MHTRISQNSNFGRPRARKLNLRLALLRRWAENMAYLRTIHIEIEPLIQARRAAFSLDLD